MANSKSESAEALMENRETRQLNDGSTDFQLRCHGRVFKVHKDLVSKHSPVFNRACTGPFKEAAQAFMHMPDDDPVYLEALLHAIYTGDYRIAARENQEDITYSQGSNKAREGESKEDGNDDTDEEVHPLLYHVHVYILACKYFVDTAKHISNEKFMRVIYDEEELFFDAKEDAKSDDWSDVDHFEPWRAHFEAAYVKAIVAAIELVYINTPSSDIMGESLACYASKRWHKVIGYWEFRTLLSGTPFIPQFGNRLAAHLLKDLSSEIWECEHCQTRAVVQRLTGDQLEAAPTFSGNPCCPDCQGYLSETDCVQYFP